MTRRVLFVLLLLVLSGCEKSRAEELPAVGTIGAFELSDQSGARFSNDQLRGKVWVAAFMFTRCPTVCPRMMATMKKLQDSAKSQGIALHLVSFSVDPDNDTPEVLRAFAARYGADLGSWSFLTGDYEVVKRTSVEGFKLALEGSANPDAADFGILHGSHLVLVDKAMRIRGFYPTKTEDSLDKLLADAKSLAR